MKLFILALTGAALVPSYAVAQEAASVIPNLAPANTAVLRTGTEVALKLSEALTTKQKALRIGQRFHMTVAEDVKVGGVVVIPVGSPAMGEVTDVRNKGMWGKSGHLAAQILYVQVNGRQIRMSGTFDDKGVTGTAGVVAAVALVPIAGFFTTGTSATIASGAGVKGFIAEDVPLSITTTAPVPLAISAPQNAASAGVIETTAR